MACSRIRALLSEYLDDTLAPQDRKAVAEHLRECAECRGELAALSAVVRELGELEPAEPPGDFLTQLHDRMDARFSLKKLARMVFMPLRVKLPLQLASAAVLGALAFLVVSTQWPGGPPTMHREAVQDSAEFERKTEAPPLPMSRSAASREKARVAEPAPVAPAVARIPIQLVLAISPGGEKKSLYHSPDQRRAAAKAAAPMDAGRMEEARQLGGKGPGSGAAGGGETGAKMKKQAEPSPAASASRRIGILARQVGGSVISTGGDRPGGGNRFVIVSIPAARYPEFMDGLKRIGVLKGTSPNMPADQNEAVEVHIRLVSAP
jgi:hypothetical protein